MNTKGCKKSTPYLFVLPILVLSGVLLYYSIGFTIYTSFFQWNGIDNNMIFIGFENYVKLFSDRVFYIAMWNNLLFMIFTIGIQCFLGLFMAVLFRAKLRGNTIFKSILFLPTIMAPVIIAAIFRILLDANLGSINNVFRMLHLNFLAVSWLGDPKYSLISVIMVNVYEWMGFSMLLYFSALLAIPEEIYESARIDGSGFWNTLFKITIPLVNGTTSTLVVLGIIGSLKTFDIVVLLTGGGPGKSTEILSTFLYKRSIQEFDGGSAAAIGVIILIISLILAITQIKLYNRSRKNN
ncbi:carbohydrate ABC transporter permease [Clostridium sp.]|uniref:carbohydrate ABC transporter permease n=1 Tax=Clostridium sp. TaxID=1506 RepID=UPI003D6D04D2